MIEQCMLLVIIFIQLLMFIGVANTYSKMKDVQHKLRKVQKSLDDMWVFYDDAE